jgi:deoxyribodipyrimidine photo-lyase
MFFLFYNIFIYLSSLIQIMNSLFIFRRDLRLEDNTALLKALDESEKVIPCFIFDDRQTKNNEYFSENAFQFMIESLKDLEEQLKEKKSRLYIFKGLAHEVVEKIIRENNIKAVYVNKDYTPFSEKRDMQLKKTCEKHNINFLQEHDYLLHKPGDIMTKEKKPYTVYTFFYKKAIEKNISLPKKLNKNNFLLTR